MARQIDRVEISQNLRAAADALGVTVSDAEILLASKDAEKRSELVIRLLAELADQFSA
jgi:hypothetical protein